MSQDIYIGFTSTFKYNIPKYGVIRAIFINILVPEFWMVNITDKLVSYQFHSPWIHTLIEKSIKVPCLRWLRSGTERLRCEMSKTSGSSKVGALTTGNTDFDSSFQRPMRYVSRTPVRPKEAQLWRFQNKRCSSGNMAKMQEAGGQRPLPHTDSQSPHNTSRLTF